MRRKGCAKGAIGKRPGRPRREGCAGVVLGERDLLDFRSDFSGFPHDPYQLPHTLTLLHYLTLVWLPSWITTVALSRYHTQAHATRPGISMPRQIARRLHELPLQSSLPVVYISDSDRQPTFCQRVDNCTLHHSPTIRPDQLSGMVWHLDHRQVAEGREGKVSAVFHRLAALTSHLEALRKVSSILSDCVEGDDPAALILTQSTSLAFSR